MADSVHYLCRVDPAVSPTTESGCTGFPFLFGYGSLGVAYPIAVPLEESTNTHASIARWFYRVRKWNISTDFSVTDSSTPTPNVWTLDNGDLLDPVSGSNPTTELDTILYAGALHSQRIYNFQFTENGGPLLEVGEIDIVTPNLIPSIAPVIVSGSDHYPSLVMSIILDKITITTIPTGATTSISGSIDGLPLTIYLEDTSGGSDTYTFGSFDLTPSEFWPYAAADGSPIYDTTTGAVLQDPRN
jgi:hypothetical protein